MNPDPVVTFKRIVPQGIPPMRATRDAMGTLPVMAVRYCEPITAASGFGWYLFPPIGFQVMFDGVGALWTYDGVEDWYPLQSAQFPGLADAWDAEAPEGAKGYSPPFLTMTEHPGTLQIWTGMIARTAPDWSLLLRAPVNLPHSPGYEPLEGIIETDNWGGPLFFNIRLINTGAPVHFLAHRPFLQVQPIHRMHYSDDFLNRMELTSGLSDLTPQDWADYSRTVVVPNSTPGRVLGTYAVAARKRRIQERQ